MRKGSLYLFFFALLFIPNTIVARQEPSANKKKADTPVDLKALATPPKENWEALSDLKTGLQPTSAAIVQQDEQADFVREFVRVQWRMYDPIDLWISRPKGAGKVPVILYLYNYSEGSDRFRDNGWCKRATANGYAAVGFVAALTDYRFKSRPLKQWFVSELPESLGSSVHDVQLILNYLADRKDLDMDHVGMFGMGSGATIAILAAHADSRIKALDVLNPWGDWPGWLRDSPVVPEAERPKYVTPEFLQSVAMLDPVAYLPTLRTQSFRLQQTSNEPATPAMAREKIAAAAPVRATLARYANAQDLLQAWKTTGLSGWIKQQMNSQVPKGSQPGRGAVLSQSRQ